MTPTISIFSKGSRRPLVVAAVLVLVLVLGLGGCSGAAGSATSTASVDPYEVAASLHATDPATTPAPTASLSPEEQVLRQEALDTPEPARSALMDEDSPQGAVAAAEYFISLYPYVYATGDLSQWHVVCGKEVAVCESVSELVTDLHRDNGWADPWEQTFTKQEYNQAAGQENTTAVRITLSSQKIVRHYADGEIVTDPSRSDEVFVGTMTWEDGRWIVSGGGFE